MPWLLYLSDENAHKDRLLKVLDASVPKSNVEICRSLQDLSKRLRRPYLDFRVIVYCIENKEELKEILYLGYFLTDMKIILVLPNKNEDTGAMGFKLLPRFVTWIDSDLSDLGAVLKRMLDLYDVSSAADDQMEMNSITER